MNSKRMKDINEERVQNLKRRNEELERENKVLRSNLVVVIAFMDDLSGCMICAEEAANEN